MLLSITLTPSFRQNESLFLFIYFFSTYTLLSLHIYLFLSLLTCAFWAGLWRKFTSKQTLFKTRVLISTFSPISSLVFFSITQEGTLVVGGPGSFYWQGNTLLLIILTFPSFHPFTEFFWLRLADTSLSYPRLSLTGPQESQFRPTNWPGWPFLHLQSRITDTQNDDTSPPMSPVTKIIRDYLSVLALPFLNLFSQSVKCSAAVHSSQMGQW